MKNRLLILLFLLLSNLFLKAQVQSNVISGKIVETNTKEPLGSASIILLNTNHKVYKKTLSSKNGTFDLPNCQSGNYILMVQFVGYTNYEQPIEITKNKDLENIELTKENSLLSEVVVKNTKPVIENKIDKVVYNVDRDISSQGGVATDILRKIPQITVDVDGNVELLGNPSIKFLIDGKSSALFGNNIAEALQSIPNSQIQSIEVMSSPSAKYEASGTGGVINIVLKKNKIEGYNGNLNLSIGTRLENGSFNTSWKHNNISINAFLSGNEQLVGTTPNGSTRTTYGLVGNQILIQESSSNFGRKSYKTGIGFEWNINKTETLTASISDNNFSNENNGIINQQQQQYNISNIEISNILSKRNFINSIAVSDFENSIGYKKELNKKGQSIEVNYNASSNKNNSYYQQEQSLLNDTKVFNGAHSLNPGKESEQNLAIDYVYPINKKVVIETGSRYTYQSIISNADVYTLNANSQVYELNKAQSYQSKFIRNIFAGYVIATYHIKSIDIKSGIRYEHTNSNANYSQNGNVNIPNYGNLAPSIILSHKYENNQVIKFAYTYRIERPDYKDLNPFMNLADPHNITTGNPNLQAEIGNNFELSINKPLANGANLNLALFCQYNSPDIKPYVTYYTGFKIGDSIYNDVAITSRANISAETRAGLNISASIPLGQKLILRPNLMLFNRHLINPFDEPKVLNSFGYRTSINSTYSINKTWAIEVFGNYNLGMKWQGVQPSNYSYTIATKKVFLSNKGSIGIVIVNPLDKYVKQTSQQLTKNTITNAYRNIPYQSFGLTFSYKFGNLKFAKTKESENFLFSPPTEN